MSYSEIHILLPSSITTARQLKVLIESDCMIISNVSSPVNAILEGKFYARCRNKEAVWNICKNVLQINLGNSSIISYRDESFLTKSFI